MVDVKFRQQGRLAEAFRTRIRNKIAEECGDLGRGRATSGRDYGHYCGRIAAFTEAIELVNELEQQLINGDLE